MRTFEKWVNLSHKLPGLAENPWIMVDFQSLGRLDVDICQAWNDKKLLINSPSTSSDQLFNIEESLRQQKTFEYSRLWVLAAYELIRIFKNIDPERFSNIYDMIRAVRIPLAKYEKAKDKSRQLSIANLAIGQYDGEIGWVTESDGFITREQIASALFTSVEGSMTAKVS